jgi:hypothetical protein
MVAMKPLLPFALLLAIGGCAPPDIPPADPAVTAATNQDSGEVTPIGSGAAAGMTPMAGTENLGSGSGGGVAQAAKGQAMSAAAAAGGSSASQMGQDTD